MMMMFTTLMVLVTLGVAAGSEVEQGYVVVDGGKTQLFKYDVDHAANADQEAALVSEIEKESQPLKEFQGRGEAAADNNQESLDCVDKCIEGPKAAMGSCIDACNPTFRSNHVDHAPNVDELVPSVNLPSVPNQINSRPNEVLQEGPISVKFQEPENVAIEGNYVSSGTAADKIEMLQHLVEGVEAEDPAAIELLLEDPAGSELLEEVLNALHPVAASKGSKVTEEEMGMLQAGGGRQGRMLQSAYMKCMRSWCRFGGPICRGMCSRYNRH